MNSSHMKDLSFGLPGEAKYDAESRKLTFQRIPHIINILHPTGCLRVLRRAIVSPDVPQYIRRRHERDMSIKQLCRIEPTFAASASHLAPLLQVSEAVLEATKVTEPPPHDLLSFGIESRCSSNDHDTTSKALIAVVTGSSGEAVWISSLRESRNISTNFLCLQKPLRDPKDKYSATWAGFAACPLEQISFSETLNGLGSRLAVRNSRGTSILNPKLRDQSIRTKAVHCVENGILPRDLHPTYLDVNHVGNVLISQTDGSSHLHVTFNPWNDNQFAILCSSGSWYIYQSSCCASSTGYTESGSSRLSQVISSLSRNSISITQGWGTILWVGGAETIIAASRLSVKVFYTGDLSKTFKVPAVTLNGDEVIVDLKRSPCKNTHFYLLTSRRLYWLQMLCESELCELESGSTAASLILSWKHSLNPHDMTLRAIATAVKSPLLYNPLHTSMDNLDLDGSLVLIYSLKSDLMIYFTFIFDGQKDVGFSASDPCYISSKSFRSANDTSSISLTLGFRVLHDPERVEDNTSAILSLVRLANDLSINEQAFVYGKGPGVNSNLAFSTPSKVPEVTFDAISRNNEDLTVHNDGPMDHVSSEMELLRHLPPLENAINRSEKVVNYEWLAEKLFELMEADRSTRLPPGTFDEEIDRILAERADLDLGLFTMAEFLSTELPVDEIDKFSTTVQEIVNSISRHRLNIGSDQEDELPPIGSYPLLAYYEASGLRGDLEGSTDILLVPLYERFLNDWIGQLSKEIPGRARILLEREFRQAAMQIFLSSYGVKTLTPQELIQIPGITSLDDFTLTLRQRDFKQPIIQESSVRDTFSTYSVLSELESRKHDLMGSQSDAASPHRPFPRSEPSERFEKLKSYVAFREPSITNTSVVNMIDQWSIGEDPSQFNWQLTREMEKKPPTPLTEKEKYLRRFQEPKNSTQLQRLTTASASQPLNISREKKWSTSSQPSHSIATLDTSTQSIPQSATFSALPDSSATNMSQKFLSAKSTRSKARRPGF